MKTQYQPKTGQPCTCKPGQQRDNCPACEGTGMRIDFAAIRLGFKNKDGSTTIVSTSKTTLDRFGALYGKKELASLLKKVL